MVTLNDAYAKLSALSEERARRVVDLIEDLAELEAREDAEDLADAKAIKAEYGDQGITLEELRAKYDL